MTRFCSKSKKSGYDTLLPMAVTVRICGSNVMPLFLLLLLVSGVTFSVFTITNGSVALKFIEMTTLLQSTFEKSSWEYIDGVPLNQSESTEQPLLTLFTTFKNRKDQLRTHWNVIKNWSLFQPRVRLILFDDDTDKSLLQFAHELNWTILPIPSKSVFGTPMLKEMFFACKKYTPNSVFYGYANGDILFDKGLPDTLDVISNYLDQMTETLVVGMRTNFRVRGRRITTLAEVHKLAKTEGKLFRIDAEDYFFLAHNKFPWDSVPDVVIGRPAYDNFLVATAQKHGVAVVDATRTLMALHQTGNDGDFAGHRYNDAQYNARLIGHFDYSKGLTSNSQYLTQYNKDGKIELWRRPDTKGPATLITVAMATTTETPGRSSSLINITKYSEDLNTNKTNRESFYTSFSTSIENHSTPHIVAEVIEEDIGQKVIDEVLDDVQIEETLHPELLTVFTVFSSHPQLHEFHVNMLKNWACFHPKLSTVLFSDSEHPDIDRIAKESNWTILPLIPSNGAFMPLKKMFLQVQHLFPKSIFYGYIKGDLLFGEGVVETFEEVAATLDNLNSALVVGAKFQYVTRTDELFFKTTQVDSIIKSKDSILQSDLAENFVLAHRTFPWQHIPDLVIGQSVYDNYLVALSLRYEFAVVDATQTLTALEQISKDPNLVPSKPDDFDPNLLAALDYTEGYVTSAQYETTFDDQGHVLLWKRQKDGKKSILLPTRNKIGLN